MHAHISIELGFLAAKLAVLAAYALGAVITAGIEAGVDIVDAALDDTPVLGAPAPHDEVDDCWLLCGLVIDITPANGDRGVRFDR